MFGLECMSLAYDSEYIGGLDEFLEWANSRYGYVDTTADLIYNMKAKSEYKKYRESTGVTFLFCPMLPRVIDENMLLLPDICMTWCWRSIGA